MPNLCARDTLSSYWAAERLPLRTPTLTLEERPLGGMIRLQGTPTAAFCQAVEQVLGLPLADAGQLASAGGVQVIWSGPREWLVLVRVADEQRVAEDLAQALAGQFANVTIISDSRLAIAVSGSAATALLAKGTGLNLSPDAFAPGSATTLRFIGMPALLLHDAAGEYRVYADVSYAAFIFNWFLDAAQEFADHLFEMQ